MGQPSAHGERHPKRKIQEEEVHVISCDQVTRETSQLSEPQHVASRGTLFQASWNTIMTREIAAKAAYPETRALAEGEVPQVNAITFTDVDQRVPFPTTNPYT